jgi:DnaJ-class molecular chaperone
MAKMLKGTGDFDPPEDEDPPECSGCNGMGRCWDVASYGYYDCPDCNGTGYQPEPEYEPGIEVDE